MSIKILFFGSLADKAGRSSLIVNGAFDLDKLLKVLKGRFPFLDSTVFAVSRNQEIVRDNLQLTDGDEIALLPPFAGG